MPARTGKQYLDNLKSLNPEIYLNGRRIAHVTEEPVFAGPLRTVAEQYDLQLDPRYVDVCTYVSPTTGERLSRSFQPCRSKEELVAKRRHFQLRAGHTFGMMGRTPDFMNAFVLGWNTNAPVFGELDERFGENARRYYERVRDNDLFLTHVLINPAIDRSKTSSQQEDPFLHLGKVRETDEGIVVRGAKMLSTMAPFAEELVVVPFGGIAPGDDDYAVVFAIPIDTPGLKFICREPVAPAGRTEFDHPLSSRFEEMDCIAVFDDVLVPWDRVVVDGRPGSRDLVNRVLGSDPSVLVVNGARSLASLELLCGIATKIADATGIDTFLHVQEKLGDLISRLETLRTLFHGAEAMAAPLPDGTWVPYLPGIMAFHMQTAPTHRRMVEVIQILAAGNFFYAPSGGDFANEELRPFIDRFVRGRPGVPAEERVRLFKLAWDVAGDGFGQRLMQYVNYYSGDPVRLTAGLYLGADKTEIHRAVDRALAGSDRSLDIPLPPEVLEMAPPPPPARPLTGMYPAKSQPSS
ncbi:4-hydroxyphenylacetate 3-hydroxylase family protein [Streptomyces sp. NBC_01306]|uniref:4-hydroxyphenylacetate 3-hydroxylase family protein n=1 Tax=Streptomyces sp. NBC_01306 TaxID=2903819 RepID=UPI002255524E|nr:4-hydroxyphenylacetate 3-hydroxylase N-terminal domain-containing protein [Streptomyces sp. NBC_01306]MCX4724041.1 4-hydroxyphenylacetate 3-monooxygenase [Streptomyces sp. NBC_01306]